MDVFYDILSLLTLSFCFIGSSVGLFAFIRMVRSDLCDRRNSSSFTDHR